MNESTERRKGAYIGTEINGKWWKRYTKDMFFARGNGEYWIDDESLHFHRYLSNEPISLPLKTVRDVSVGKWHSGRWAFGKSIIKISWEKDDQLLCSGFLVSNDPTLTDAFVTELRDTLKKKPWKKKKTTRP